MSPATRMTGAPEHWQIAFLIGVLAFVIFCAYVGFGAFVIARALDGLRAPDDPEDPDDAH